MKPRATSRSCRLSDRSFRRISAPIAIDEETCNPNPQIGPGLSAFLNHSATEIAVLSQRKTPVRFVLFTKGVIMHTPLYLKTGMRYCTFTLAGMDAGGAMTTRSEENT